MSNTPAFFDILRCPQTGQQLILNNDQLETEDRSISYPVLSGVPWLLARPRNSLLDWGAKLNHFQQTFLQEISQLEVEKKSLKGEVYNRIHKLQQAKKDFVLEVSQILEPITAAKVAPKEQYDALLDRAPGTQNLLSYEANIYRDWQWGEEENQLSLGFLSAIAPEKLGKLCVLGAGAARLAYDLHHTLDPELTVATDINPLFIFAAQKLITGQDFELTEFPLQPKKTEYVALKHQYKAIAKHVDNFYLCFADAAKPAFQNHIFDTLVTPWLIDIQPYEFTRFLKQLNQYLPVGGIWLNFGSLVFNQNRDVLCYTHSELSELLVGAGFEIETIEQQELPYLKSPYNAGYRVENVWLWRARKVKHIDAESDMQVTPEWVLDTTKTIPKTDDRKAMLGQHRFLSEMYSQIDQGASIHSIAQHFAKREGVSVEEYESLLVNYFLSL